MRTPRTKLERQFGLVGPDVSDEQADEILTAGAAAHVDETLTHTAVGTPDHVRDSLDYFLQLTNADELITVPPAPTADDRLHSITLLAEATQSVTA